MIWNAIAALDCGCTNRFYDVYNGVFDNNEVAYDVSIAQNLTNTLPTQLKASIKITPQVNSKPISMITLPRAVFLIHRCRWYVAHRSKTVR